MILSKGGNLKSNFINQGVLMSFLDLVNKRNSCRKYLPQKIEKEKIERCLEAARLAPSACNSQSWHFIIVMEDEIRERLAEKAFSGVYQINSFAKKAPVLVVIMKHLSFTFRFYHTKPSATTGYTMIYCS